MFFLDTVFGHMCKSTFFVTKKNIVLGFFYSSKRRKVDLTFDCDFLMKRGGGGGGFVLFGCEKNFILNAKQISNFDVEFSNLI